MKFRAKESLPFAYLLNIVLPGLGHIFWRDILFGLFIYLIMFTAVALFFLSYFVSLGWGAKLALFGLPAVFYIFSFVDLTRTVKTKRRGIHLTTRKAMIFLAVGILHLVLAPNSPGNFMLRNLPSIYEADRAVPPKINAGDLVMVNRLAYSADIFFFPSPVIHELPRRFDVVRFKVNDQTRATGVVLALPAESIELIDGTLLVDGVPLIWQPEYGVTLRGDWPLTSAGNRSILVATLRFASIDRVYEVPIEDVIGTVSKIL
jgi:hypothetical protein